MYDLTYAWPHESRPTLEVRSKIHKVGCPGLSMPRVWALGVDLPTTHAVHLEIWSYSVIFTTYIFTGLVVVCLPSRPSRMSLY